MAQELFEVMEYPNPDKWDDLDEVYKSIYRTKANILIESLPTILVKDKK